MGRLTDPMMCTPNRRSVLASDNTFTIPSVSAVEEKHQNGEEYISGMGTERMGWGERDDTEDGMGRRYDTDDGMGRRDGTENGLGRRDDIEDGMGRSEMIQKMGWEGKMI